MPVLSFKEHKLVEFPEAKKRILMDQLKGKSISYEHLEAKEKHKMIVNELKIFASSHKLNFEEQPDQTMLDLYGLKLFYPDATGKLAGVCRCNDVQYTALKELLLKLSHVVELKVKDNEQPKTFLAGEEQ